jgi:hypothetical protein
VRQGRTVNHSCTNNLAPAELTILDILVGARARRTYAEGDPIASATAKTKFEFVINLKTAKVLRVKISDKPRSVR